MLGRNLIYVMSGAFLLSVPKFRETSKISDLLTSGDPDIKLICINCGIFTRYQILWFEAVASN